MRIATAEALSQPQHNQRFLALLGAGFLGAGFDGLACGFLTGFAEWAIFAFAGAGFFTAVLTADFGAGLEGFAAETGFFAADAG